MKVGTGVSVYKKYISADYNKQRGSQCGYHTSCSTYAKASISEQGVGGLLPSLARLRKCTPDTRAYRRGELWRYAVNCPDNQIEQFFQFSSPEVKERFLTFRGQLLDSARQIASGQRAEGAEGALRATTEFLGEVHLSLEDLPGKSEGPRRFHLAEKVEPKPILMADRGIIANGLRTTAGTAVGALGAVVGGVAGMGLGIALGAYEGLASGLGLRHLIEHRAEKKRGKGALGGTKPIREIGDSVYQSLQERIGLEPLSSVIGGAVGLTAGLIGGLVGGAAKLGGMGWKMGKVLGRNRSDATLKQHFPSRGEMVVERASARPAGEILEVSELAASEASEEIWSIFTDTPEEFVPKKVRPEGAPSWQFAVFSDATAANIESQELRRVIEFERELPENTKARIHVRRAGVIPRRFRKLVTFAKSVSSVLGLAAIGGAAGLPLMNVYSRLNGFAHSLSALKEVARDSTDEAEPDWTGRRTYSLDLPLPEEHDHIQSQPVHSHKAASPVSVDKLAADLQASFPDSGPRVAVFAGHANSYEWLAGYKPEKVSQALSQAARKSGQKVDLLVVDACNAATLEALEPMAEGARFALVSQLPVGKVGMPWHSILKNIDALGQTPEELGSGIVENFGGLKSLPSLSLINLEKLPGLRRELERLIEHLPEEVNLAELTGAGDLSQVRDEGFAKKLSRRLQRLKPGSQSVDLAAVLEEFAEVVDSPAGREQLAKTKEALKDCVVSAKGNDLGGLSVEGHSPFFDQSRYQQRTQNDTWGELLGEHQFPPFKVAAKLGSARRSFREKTHRFARDVWHGKPE